MSAHHVIHVWLGHVLERVLSAGADDISQDLSALGAITIASNQKRSCTSSLIAAHHLAALLRRDTTTPGSPNISRVVSVIEPDDTRARLAASLRIARRYNTVVITAPAAKYCKLPVRRDVAEAQALIGVGSVESSRSPGLLAIGHWTQYIDPRLSVSLLHPSRREPKVADVALAISPTIAGTLLIGQHLGYVVCIWARDLVAAELAGLGLWSANLPDRHDRFGPWEDPVVQRSTDLDLGALVPSDLSIRAYWVGDKSDERGLSATDTLASTIATLLNIETGHV